MTRDRGAPATARHVGEEARSRGVAVFLDVPDGADFPDTAGLLELAGALHELATELVPGASTRTEVVLGRGADPHLEPVAAPGR